MTRIASIDRILICCLLTIAPLACGTPNEGDRRAEPTLAEEAHDAPSAHGSPTAHDAQGSDVVQAGFLSVSGASAQIFPSTGSVYLRIDNSGDSSERLTGVESSVSEQVETHESVMDGDIMRMVHHPDGFEVPAQGALVFEPGGKHIMLLSPQVAAEQSSIQLVLHFETADAIVLEAPIVDAMDSGMEHHH